MLEVLDLGSASQVLHQCKHIFPDQTSFSREQIKTFWENIIGNLDLPEGDNANLSMAVPRCYDCLNRSIIMNILTQKYGYKKINILPRSLALLCGYTALHPEIDWRGNMVCISADDDNLDFSFISISESIICLELQYIGNWQNIQEEVALLGLLSNPGWNISKILYANSSSVRDLHLPGADLDKHLNIIKVEEPDQIIQIGLSQDLMIAASQGKKRLTIIYPYDFYMERINPLTSQSIREKLWFDTANLELDLNGAYKIASLPVQSLFLNPEDSYLDLAVYEVARSPLSQNPFNGLPSMKLRLNQADQSKLLDIWLDMDAASISFANSTTQVYPKQSPTDEWLAGCHKSQRELADLLQSSANQRLQQDLAQHLLARQDLESPHDIEDYLKTMQLKLYGLLELARS